VKRGTTRPEPEPRANDGIGSEIMTLRDVADYLNCHYMTIYRLIKSGALPAFRIGSDFRFRRADLKKWIAQQHVGVESGAPKAPTQRVARKPRSNA